MKTITNCPNKGCNGVLVPSEKENLKAGECFFDCYKCHEEWKIV